MNELQESLAESFLDRWLDQDGRWYVHFNGKKACAIAQEVFDDDSNDTTVDVLKPGFGTSELPVVRHTVEMGPDDKVLTYTVIRAEYDPGNPIGKLTLKRKISGRKDVSEAVSPPMDFMGML